VTKGRQAYHDTVIGRKLRLLRRAIRRVPLGAVLDREAHARKTWDAATGLFLPRMW
jgi:hypothetical protein